LEGGSFVTPISPEVVPWSRPQTSEDFPSPGFITPHPVRVVDFTERETFVPSSPVTFFPNTQLFPSSPRNSVPVSHVHTPSPPVSPRVHVQMVGANPPRNRMAEILAARYAPLVLPQPMNTLPTTKYLKYMPQFTGEGDVTARRAPFILL
jgi:hypothetical protein